MTADEFLKKQNRVKRAMKAYSAYKEMFSHVILKFKEQLQTNNDYNVKIIDSKETSLSFQFLDNRIEMMLTIVIDQDDNVYSKINFNLIIDANNSVNIGALYLDDDQILKDSITETKDYLELDNAKITLYILTVVLDKLLNLKCFKYE